MSKFVNWAMRSFPAPDYLTMPAAALDISPNSIKYLDGTYTANGCLPQSFDEIFLDDGVIKDGAIQKHELFVDALKQLRNKHKYKYVFVAIPENALYLYSLELSGRPNKASIIQQIEFTFKDHVPIDIEDAVYDFDIVAFGRTTMIISVTVAPKDIISGYEIAIREAGFIARAVELEAYAVARAVTAKISNSSEVNMVIDIGYNRAGIIIVRNNLPIFTITIPGGSKNTKEVIEECKKQYLFWDTRTNKKGKRIGRVSKVIVCGGSALEFSTELEKTIEANIQIANVWQNLFDIEDFVPNINSKEALAMATLAGLLLNNKS